MHDQERFSEGLEIHVVELPKLSTVTDQIRGAEPGLVAWARFLGAANDQEVEDVCMNNPEIAKAKATLDRLSADPSTQELARRRKLALATFRHTMAAAQAEGRAEGRAEGQAMMGQSALVAVLEARGFVVSQELRARISAAGLPELERWISVAVRAGSVDEVLSRPRRDAAAAPTWRGRARPWPTHSDRCTAFSGPGFVEK